MAKITISLSGITCIDTIPHYIAAYSTQLLHIYCIHSNEFCPSHALTLQLLREISCTNVLLKELGGRPLRRQKGTHRFILYKSSLSAYRLTKQALALPRFFRPPTASGDFYNRDSLGRHVGTPLPYFSATTTLNKCYNALSSPIWNSLT